MGKSIINNEMKYIFSTIVIEYLLISCCVIVPGSIYAQYVYKTETFPSNYDVVNYHINADTIIPAHYYNENEDTPPSATKSSMMKAAIGLGYEVVLGAFWCLLIQDAFWDRDDFTKSGKIDNPAQYIFMIGSTLGVLQAGKVQNQSGSSLLTFLGGITGVIVGKQIGSAGVYLGGPVFATIAYEISK